MTWPYLEHSGTLAFAHRGGNRVAPENTVGAFAHSWSLGYQFLETDVHLSKDGVLVAFHDAGLERVSGLEGQIADNTWADLQAVDLGDGHGIPTLDQLLEEFPSAHFNIDPKADESVELLANTLQKHDALDRVGIGSFSDQRIATLRNQLGPRLCTSPGPRSLARLAFLVRTRRRLNPALNAGFGCVQLPPVVWGMKLTRRLTKGFQQLGLQVHVWTINSEAEMHRLLDLGVDGLMTDDTALLRGVLTERGQWNGAV